MWAVNGPVWDLWDAGGPFLGDDARPHHRVTVEPSFQLQTSIGSVGSHPGEKLPIRWFQRFDNSQVEQEIPGIKSIHISKSLDQNAATAEIVLYNQKMLPQLSVSELGNPGYYSWNRGAATNRWGHQPNEWWNILVPDALIRTYQGYGGYSNGVPIAIRDATAAGSLVQTGLWLVDDVQVSTAGTITLKCRDMIKLLVDQQLFVGVVPSPVYPLHYTRYYQQEIDTPAASYGRLFNNGARFVTGGEPDTSGNGYWLLGDDGGVFTFGQAVFYGSAGSQYVHGCVGIARTRQGDGYYVATKTGQVLYFNGPNLSELAPGVINAAHGPFIVAIERANLVNQDGFWLMNSLGEIYTFGTAGYHGGGGLATTAVDLASTITGNGYWLLDSAGQVYTFGDAQYYGNSPNNTGSPAVAIAVTPTGKGYYISDAAGHIYTFGDAVYHGGAGSIVLNDPICDIMVDPLQRGYWLVAADGGVFTFGGSADTHFNQPTTSLTIFDSDGAVQDKATNIAVQDAQHLTFTLNSDLGVDSYTLVVTSAYEFFGPGVPGLNTESFTVPFNVNGPPPPSAFGAVSMSPSALPEGYAPQKITVVGTVAGQAILPFYGSLPGALTIFIQEPGNYADYADVVRDLVLWSGFWLYPFVDSDGVPAVYGGVETTGAYATQPLPDSMFDKVPVIDAITKIKEIVGYILYGDQFGGFNFTSPNWWGPGNFMTLDGSYTAFIPVIDERHNLSDYTAGSSDKALRSQIIISSSNPYPIAANIQQTEGGSGPPAPGTVTTAVTPPSAAGLKGIQKPAMWVNEAFIDQSSQQVMAELIGIQIWFQQRLGSASCQGNPYLDVDQQVQLYERQTDEVYIHYIRGIDSSADLEAGTWSMTLTTHWLGLADAWPVQKP